MSQLYKRSDDPRYLHSFPTRRSSDLVCAPETSTSGKAATNASVEGQAQARQDELVKQFLGSSKPLETPPVRPQEQTSEVESPVHMVWRHQTEIKRQARQEELIHHIRR